MKAQLGKPTGLALALLATLLATFFAMGVFSVAQANGHHSADQEFFRNHGGTWGRVTVVTITLSDYGEFGQLLGNVARGFHLCLQLDRMDRR